jgi:heme/copper-type cytochrome/quinol oxidase subunit 3
MAEHAQPMTEAMEDALENERTSTGQTHRKILMWSFLGSECMFFGALLGTFLVYHNNSADGAPREEVLSSLGLVSVMAFVLLVSSFTMVLGLAAARRGDQKMMMVWLLTTAFCGLFFIGAQGFEFWSFVNHKHLTPQTSLFGASFMTLTGFHGAHVSVGILWLISAVLLVRLHPSQRLFPIMATMLPKFMRSLSGLPHRPQEQLLEAKPRHRRFVAFVREQFQTPIEVEKPDLTLEEHEARRVAKERILNIEIVGLYWHFVDIVWVVIFTVVYLFTGRLDAGAS